MVSTSQALGPDCKSTHIGSVLVVSQSIVLQRRKLLAVPVGSVDGRTSSAVFIATTYVSSIRSRTTTDVHVVTQVEDVVYVLVVDGSSVCVEESVGPVGATET